MPIRSLKYSIAITIFVLEGIMLSLVLWQTQSTSFSKSETMVEQNDLVIIGLLAEVSHTALLTNEFNILQPYFLQTIENPHVELIFLSNHRNIVVASSSNALFGQHIPPKENNEESYWRQLEIENSSSEIGNLHILFSNRELNKAYEESLQLGIYIAISGMIIIAIASLLMGTVLTRRLKELTRHARLISQNNLDKTIQFNGKDEVAELAHALNTMTQKVSQSFSHMKHMAYHDSLTGLANRHSFKDKLQQAITSATTLNQRHALMFLDLDQFKAVNDTGGHDAGDALLAQLAQVLQEQLRPNDNLARLGGDEFGVLIENCSLEAALERAEQLRETVKGFQFRWQDKYFRIGVSIGLAAINSKTDDLKELLRSADMACYAAKNKGRNTIHLVQNDDMPKHFNAEAS